MNFTPQRSEAIRAGLISEVAARPSRRRRWLASVGLVMVGALAGAGAATAFATTGSWLPAPAQGAAEPSPEAPPPAGEGGAVEAPLGHEPGAPIISTLGAPFGQVVNSTAVLPLDPPAGATHVRVTVSCEGDGAVFWGPDPDGNNPSVEGCDNGVTAWYDFPLDDTVTALHITPDDGTTAAVTVQYLNYAQTRLGVNQHGQTYGDGTGDQVPDLIYAIGQSPDGEEILGYVRAEDLAAFSPDHPGSPANPEEALRWMKEREQRYPNGYDVPLFASDGTTQLGTFHVY